MSPDLAIEMTSRRGAPSKRAAFQPQSIAAFFKRKRDSPEKTPDDVNINTCSDVNTDTCTPM